MRDIWNEEWAQSDTDKKVHSWIKSIYNIPEYFPINYYQTQLITNHRKFPYCFKKIRETENSDCECGAEAEEFQHYIGNFPITKTLSDTFIAKNPSGPTSKEQRSEDTRNPHISIQKKKKNSRLL